MSIQKETEEKLKDYIEYVQYEDGKFMLLNRLNLYLVNHFEDYESDFSDPIDFYMNELKEKFIGDATDIEEIISDFSHGCSTGVVSSLIYYEDTCAFFRRYKMQIAELLQELQDDLGQPWMDCFRDFDKTDIFCEYEVNQNLLAWYLFEEINYVAEMWLDELNNQD